MDLELQKFIIESLKRTLKREPTKPEIDKHYAIVETEMKAGMKVFIEALKQIVKFEQIFSEKVERDASTIDRMHHFKPDKKHFWSFVKQNFTHDEIDEMAYNDPATTILKYIERYKEQMKTEYTLLPGLTRRQQAIIYYFKVEAYPTQFPLPRKELINLPGGQNIYMHFLDVSNNRKPPKPKEIESILPHLEDFPEALKKANELKQKLL